MKVTFWNGKGINGPVKMWEGKGRKKVRDLTPPTCFSQQCQTSVKQFANKQQSAGAGLGKLLLIPES